MELTKYWQIAKGWKKLPKIEVTWVDFGQSHSSTQGLKRYIFSPWTQFES